MTINNSPMKSADTTAIDKIVKTGMAQSGAAPGVVVGVWSPQGTYVKAFGTGVAVNDHFRFGSVTKTFTGTLVLRAVDQGLLSLNDPLSKYVSGVPNGNSITIQNLLMMQSGAYDYQSNQLLEIAYTLLPTMPWTSAQSLALIKSNKSQFTPGTQYQYTNSNHILLGYVLQTVTKRTITDLFVNDLIKPLNLTQTSWPTGNGLPSPSATGYGTWPIIGLRRDITSLNPNMFWAAGQLVGTIGDLLKWGQELRDGTLLSPAMQQLRLTTFNQEPYTGTGPPTFGYGLAEIEIEDWRGHDGSVPGFDCAVMFHEATGSVIAVWENFQTAGLESLVYYWYNIAKYVVPGSVDLRAASAPKKNWWNRYPA